MSARATTPSQENYIERIYKLGRNAPVRPSQLADGLGVKRPSVTRALQSLAESGLVHYEPYGAVELTAEGRSIGRALVRRDACLTRLLVEVLDMRSAEAEPEVHRLEHMLGDDVLSRLEALVDFACSSQAWLKRLHHRIGLARNAESHTEGFSAGNTQIHPSVPNEETM